MEGLFFMVEMQKIHLRRWVQIFFMFTPILGEGSHFDSYFSTGLKPPTSLHPIVKVDGAIPQKVAISKGL